MSGIES